MPYRRRPPSPASHFHSPDQRWFRCPRCQAKIKGAYEYRKHADRHPRRPDLEQDEIIVFEG